MPGAGGDAAGDGLSEGSTGKGTGLRHEAGGAPGIGQRPGFHGAPCLAQTNTVLATVMINNAFSLVNRGTSWSLEFSYPRTPRQRDARCRSSGCLTPCPMSSLSWSVLHTPNLFPEPPRCSLLFPLIGTWPFCPPVSQAGTRLWG